MVPYSRIRCTKFRSWDLGRRKWCARCAMGRCCYSPTFSRCLAAISTPAVAPGLPRKPSPRASLEAEPLEIVEAGLDALERLPRVIVLDEIVLDAGGSGMRE